MVKHSTIKTWLTAAAFLFLPLSAYAAGLGKLTVTSGLGQPLRAEIELLSVQKDELSSVVARIASLDAYREAKIERATSLSSIKISVENRANGEPYLKVISTKPVNDPYVDMLIELNWASGRLLREYTLLLDPPGFAEARPVPAQPIAMPSVAPSVERRSEPNMAAPTNIAPRRSTSTTRSGKRSKTETKNRTPAEETFPKLDGEPSTPVPAPANASPEPEAAADTYGPVKKGDTLAQIASSLKPEGVSLEQMLVGLYKNNTKAFAGNMNRLKTGQILRVPDADQLKSVEKKQAQREIKLQAADWNAYRQKLAGAVAQVAPEKSEAGQQEVTGKITPKVEDQAASAKTPSKDVLKLSKGEAAGVGQSDAATTGKGGKDAKALRERIQSLEEEAVAKEKTIRESNERVAALEKNVQDMKQLLELKNQNLAALQKQAATKAVPPPPPVAVPEVKPAPPVEAAKPPVTPETPLVKAVPEGTSAEAPPAPAATPAPAAPTPPPVVTPKPEVAKPKPAVAPAPTAKETAWYDDLLKNPLYWGAGLAVLALIGVLWLMVLGNRRRKSLTSFEDSIMTGGDLKANTVYGDTSGGVIDTGDTSFLTDFSQAGLGTIDTNDVDPIAEAEVYMAYGRDAQAEEILKEALTKDPNRHEIHLKLLEIYAGRKNVAAFETLASELYAATGGQASTVWEKAAEMGRQLDPDNPLYTDGGPAPSGSPHKGGSGVAMAAAGAGVVAGVVAATAAQRDRVKHEEVMKPVSNISMEDGLNAMQPSPAVAEEALDFDLDFASPDQPTPAHIHSPSTHEVSFDESDMGSKLGMDTIIPQAFEKQMHGHPPAAAPALASEFDFDDALTFDTTSQPAPSHVAPQAAAHVAEDTALDFDFDLDEEAASATSEQTIMPELDLTGINLDLDESPQLQTHTPSGPDTEIGEWQEVSTKIDLAKAYVDMGDKEGAREILQEVLVEGDRTQQDNAKALLASL